MKIRVLTWLLILLMSGSSLLRATDDACRMMDGYVDPGIGGTGYGDPDEEKGNGGIGGTGFRPDESGLGGTGIIWDGKDKSASVYVTGTIYAFGSICVNGLRITYDQDTPVQDGETKSSAKGLALGQVVSVEADRIPGSASLRARQIELEHAIEGPVSGVDAKRGVISVMGEPVRLAGAFTADSFHVGEPVRVSGLRNAKDEIVASHIARASSSAGKVEGRLHRDQKGRLVRIGQVPVHAHENTDVADVFKDKGKDTFYASGKWDSRVQALVVDRFEKEEPESRKGRSYVSVEGYVGDISDSGRAQICNDTFDISKLDRKLKEGERVILTGFVGSDGRISAQRVKEVSRPMTRIRMEGDHRGRGRGGDGDDDRSGHGGGDDDADRDDDHSGSGRDGSGRDDDRSGSGGGDRDRGDRDDRSGSGGGDRDRDRGDRSGRGGGDD